MEILEIIASKTHIMLYNIVETAFNSFFASGDFSYYLCKQSVPRSGPTETI